jgi:NAD(P)-dependent dehydrogenase (short-subunit alcohol dehydrogenase family)
VSMFDLRGHVALVTGGNSGIGLGMAHGLAQAGADVCIWGTNAERNESAAAELAKHGTRVRALRCDVGEEPAVAEAFAETLRTFGRVDSCFANAGVGGHGTPFIQTTLEDFRRVTRVNLDGAFLTLRAAAAHMVDRGDDRLRTRHEQRDALRVAGTGIARLGASPVPRVAAGQVS